MVIECKYKDIQAHLSNVCEFVTENCSYSFINFYSVHYCYLEHYLWASLSIVSVIAFLCFYLLSDTSNRYLSTCLTLMSDKLKLSQNLAGLTFLAFGNGAADVISSVVASGDEGSDGIDFALGALMGAGVFVTTIVLSTVVIFAKHVQVDSGKFIRDILLYLFTLGILCLFSYDGKITLLESILFFLIYTVYVVVAFIEAKCSKQEGEEEMEDPDMTQEIVEKIVHDFSIVNYEEEESEEENDKEICLAKIDAINTVVPERTSLVDVMKDEHFYEGHTHDHHHHKKHSLIFEQSNVFHQLIIKSYANLNYKIKKQYFLHNETKFPEKGVISKVLYLLVEFPLTLLRDLTIPPCDLDRWNRTMFIFMPISCFWFIVFTTQSLHLILENTNYIIILAVVTALWIIFNYSYTYRNRLPSYEFLMAIGTFVMACFWIWFTSNILLDALKLVGVIFNLPEAFLAMSLLSFGNSVPDLSVNIALAKSGYGEMGIAGSIAGPLFNVLFGLGFALIKKTISGGAVEFTFFDFDKKIIQFISLVALSVNLLVLLVQSVFLKGKLTRVVSVFGFIMYVLFIIAICYYTL